MAKGKRYGWMPTKTALKTGQQERIEKDKRNYKFNIACGAVVYTLNRLYGYEEDKIAEIMNGMDTLINYHVDTDVKNAYRNVMILAEEEAGISIMKEYGQLSADEALIFGCALLSMASHHFFKEREMERLRDQFVKNLERIKAGEIHTRATETSVFVDAVRRKEWA